MTLRYDSAEYTIRSKTAGEISKFKVTCDKTDFSDYDALGYKVFKSFTMASENCDADIKYTNEHRKGASAILVKNDGSTTTMISNEKYSGGFEVKGVENLTIGLYLTLMKHTVTILKSENGVISCGEELMFYEGETVEFRLTPDDKYYAEKIIIGGEEFTPDGNVFYYTILSDIDVSASFKPDRKMFTVTIRQTTGGTVSHKGTVTVFEGDSLTLVMKPDDGHYLSMIEINKELMERSETYTIENITEDLIVFITFKQSKTYSIVLKHTAGGTVTADDTDVFYGGSTKIRITPDEGYVVDKVIADSGTLTATSDPNIYRLKSITVDTTVTVSFKKLDGELPPPPVEMLKVSDVTWDYHPIRLELFEYTVISEDVIEKLKTDYPDIAFSIIGEGFNWNFAAGDAEHFLEGDLDFGVLVGRSEFEENHLAFAGGSNYISVTIPDGTPTVGELKVFAGRPFTGLPFRAFSYSDGKYTQISECFCDAYFEVTIPLGNKEILMLCNAEPANTVTIKIEGNGTATPNATKYIKDGDSIKYIFEPDASSYLARVTINGSPAYMNGHVLLIENVTEDLEIVCVFLPHESSEISRYQLPIIENRADIIVYVFAFVGVGCYLVYIILRRTGKIKYKKEL